MKYYKFNFKLGLLNIIAIILLITMCFLTYYITGSISFLSNFDFIIIILMFLWFILHELLHGLGFLALGKVKLQNVIFGAELEKGIFYVMCKEEISKTNILVSLIFPLVLIGILTYIIGLCIHSDILVFLSILNIGGASGDIMMFLDILKMPKDIKYLDLDNADGFTILSKEDLSKQKYLGIKLVESGKYTNKIKPTDFKRLKISKFSAIILSILFILLIIEIIIENFL